MRSERDSSNLRRWPRPDPPRRPVAARCRPAGRADARSAPSPRYMRSERDSSNLRRWPRPDPPRRPVAARHRSAGRADARPAPSPRYTRSERGRSNPRRWARPDLSHRPVAARGRAAGAAGRAGARRATSPRYVASGRTFRARRPHRPFCPRRASRPRGGTKTGRGVGSSCRLVLQGLRRTAPVAADEPAEVGTAPPRGKPRRRVARNPGQPSSSSNATRSGRSIEVHACRAAAT